MLRTAIMALVHALAGMVDMTVFLAVILRLLSALNHAAKSTPL